MNNNSSLHRVSQSFPNILHPKTNDVHALRERGYKHLFLPVFSSFRLDELESEDELRRAHQETTEVQRQCESGQSECHLLHRRVPPEDGGRGGAGPAPGPIQVQLDQERQSQQRQQKGGQTEKAQRRQSPLAGRPEGGAQAPAGKQGRGPLGGRPLGVQARQVPRGDRGQVGEVGEVGQVGDVGRGLVPGLVQGRGSGGLGGGPCRARVPGGHRAPGAAPHGRGDADEPAGGGAIHPDAQGPRQPPVEVSGAGAHGGGRREHVWREAIPVGAGVLPGAAGQRGGRVGPVVSQGRVTIPRSNPWKERDNLWFGSIEGDHVRGGGG